MVARIQSFSGRSCKGRMIGLSFYPCIAVYFGICRTKIIRMKHVQLRFYEELNDYLPEDKRKRSFSLSFAGEVTVGRLLRAVGVPSSEVDLVLCGGESVEFDHVVEDGKRIAVFPVFESLDLQGTTAVRNEPLRHPAFVTGPGLTRLAAYLRMLGFDTISCDDSTLREPPDRSRTSSRILLTRDPSPVSSPRVLRIHGARPRRQALQVVAALDLRRRIRPLGRCPRCNSDLGESCVPLPACSVCETGYRDGPHLRRVQRVIRHLSQDYSTSAFPPG